VRDRLARIQRDLPESTEAPVVTKLDPAAAPVVYVALRSSNAATREVTTYADDVLRPALEALAGVGQVQIIGGRDRQIRVQVDPVALRKYNIPPALVLRALSTENLSVPGGRIEDGRTQSILRVYGKVESPTGFARIPVRTVGDRTIEVGDLAQVEDAAESAESLALWNGEPGVILAIRKQSGANTIAVVDKVRERLDEVGTALPEGWSLDVVRDESGSIRTGTAAVTEHLIIGAFLAALVVLLFLGSPTSTLIASLAIPTSVLGTFAVMAAIGYTLNNITLLALALSVGIVIDDAIVVLENIFRRIEHEGESPMVAAVEGTREIGLAVLATSLSLIAVFLPVVFLAGIPGRFLRAFGITMSVAIAVSLFVSFTLTPMLASRWLRPPGAEPTWLERFVDRFYRPIEGLYMVVLGFSLRQRWLVVLVSVGSLFLIPYFGGKAKKGFLPVDDQAQFEISVRAPEGTALPTTSLETERLAALVRTWPEVEHTLVTVGADDQKNVGLGSIYVRLIDPERRLATQNVVQDRARTEIAPLAAEGWRVTVANVSDIGGGGRASARVQFNLSGPDLKELERIATEVVERLKQVPGAVDVDSTLDPVKPEIGIHIDRERAADLGVSIADLATTLRLLVGGDDAGSYTENGQRYDVHVQGAPGFRDDREQLADVLVPSSTVGGVQLSSVATIEDGVSAASVNRTARQRSVTLFANAGPGHGDGEIGDAMQRIARDEVGLPAGYHMTAQGQSKLMAETARSVLFGFGLAFIFMYLVLAAQFESWLHPMTILMSLPLTLPFAMASLLIFDQALDMFSALGIFVLFGIVKKNAILQIDHSNHLREGGLPRYEAVMKANKERLRPILMTTLAFVAGMIPLVTSRGIGSGFNRATAGVVVGGQSLSLALTLIAVPVAYTLFDDIASLAWRLVAWVRGTPRSVPGAVGGAE